MATTFSDFDSGPTRSFAAEDVSIDTRTLKPGDLFVALNGESRDGHRFVQTAFERGAAAALVSQRPDNLSEEASLLLVANTQRGLEDLGCGARARAQGKVIAVTGSAGKTTSKEMLRLAFGALGQTHASASSYNNHWGVPLSLAQFPRESRFGVFEIGMNHFGEIRRLVDFVQPHAAIVTTVAPAHLEYFGSLEAIADAKSEIFEGLQPDGAAIIPVENPCTERLIARARQASVERILTFGQTAADARILSITDLNRGMRVETEILGKRHVFAIGAAGMHIAHNALATLLAATEPTAGGRRIAVLGDMLELGPESAALHADLASAIEEARADLVFACGRDMRALYEALPPSRRGSWGATSSEIAPALVRALRAGDEVLIKGSLGSCMAVILDALKAGGGSA